MKLLMITGDRALAQGRKGPFYYMLEEFSKYWERIDIICPRISTNSTKRSGQSFQLFSNVYVYSSSWPIIFQPWFILKKGQEIYKEQKFDLFTVHGYPPFYNDIGGHLLYNKLTRQGKYFLELVRRPSEAPHSSSSASLSSPCGDEPCPLRPAESSKKYLSLPVPYILEVMHITGYPKAGNFKEWFYKILTEYFIKFSAKKAKVVRVINKKQTPEFLKKAGVPEKKMKYIPAFYIDLEVFKPEEIEKPQTRTPQENKFPTGQASLVKGKKYDMVFSGRLVKNKGIILLLEAIKHIKQTEKSDIKLVIIGSGSLESEIKKYIKRNNLENNVIFSGWLPGVEDVAKIYNQSKIFVMPSFNEGGPRVTLEAMACKVPVITSKVGIMLDIIKHGENGLFIDWDVKDIAEKILLLLQDENLRNKIAENGYQTVQQFERKKAIRNYALNYQKLVQNL